MIDDDRDDLGYRPTIPAERDHAEPGDPATCAGEPIETPGVYVLECVIVFGLLSAVVVAVLAAVWRVLGWW